MSLKDRTHKELQSEIENLRLRLEEADDTLRAIGNGEVDAFVVAGLTGNQIFTLKGAEHPYRVLVETMNEGAATLAVDGTILYCNNRLAVLLQLPAEKIIGTQFGSYVVPADKSLVAARLSRCSIESDRDEITLVTGNGNFIPVLISCCTLDLSGIQGIAVVVTNLTQQKRNEEFMVAEKLARSIIEQAGEAIIVCDESGRVINASLLAHQLCGENPLLKPIDESFQLRMIETGEAVSGLQSMAGVILRNVEVTLKRGETRASHLILNAAPLKSSEGKTFGCVVTLTDITKHKQAEKKIKKSLAEKEVMLREIHHRVKNNLQVISSLVSLQLESLTDDRIRDELNDVRDRVRSMALIHEKLYQASDLSQLNFADYASSLLCSLWRSHGTLAENVRLNLALEPVALSIEAAVPCGLIINELAVNALKHAFLNNSGGEVTVGLEHDPSTGTVCLRVRDNGVGLPTDLDWRQSRSLGLRLVQILTGQLRGTVETGPGPGSEFLITFPLTGFQG